jgi:hypothetical protein
MPKQPYVSLQDRFSVEEERAKWGVPSKRKNPGTMDSIQEALQQGWIPENEEDVQQQQQQPVDPITQGITAVQQKTAQELRRFFHGESIE